MYIGPSLVDRFVQFVRRCRDVAEGLLLVAILLTGKAAETLASHHYEFQGQRLGMRIHAALLAAVYRKALRLSTGARRAHGAGTIGLPFFLNLKRLFVAHARECATEKWLFCGAPVVCATKLYFCGDDSVAHPPCAKGAPQNSK